MSKPLYNNNDAPPQRAGLNMNEPGRPWIDAGDQDVQRITGVVWPVLIGANDPPVLFRNGNSVVRLETGDNGGPILQPVTPERIIHRLAETANWYKYDRQGNMQPARPPRHLALNLLATPDNDLPILSQIVGAPVFASDGSLQSEPGYCEVGRTLYVPSKGFALPIVSDRPTPGELQLAKELILDELLADFPFTGSAERTHALCALLLLFARGLVVGPCPLHLIEKPTPGTGGTLLAQAICYPMLGVAASGLSEPKDEGEWRRTLIAKLRQGPTIILIDNVRYCLESGALASAITATFYEDRIVGESNMVSASVRCLWIATGNNPRLSDEMARRTVRIRLDARVERPELRTGFRHPMLLQWAAQNRDILVWAALTIIQAWIAAGRPPGRRLLGMFENWSETMGGIMKVAQLPGFLENLDEVRKQADSETPIYTSFATQWWEKFGDQPVGVSELWDSAQELDLGDGSEHSRKIRLGKLIDSLRDRQLAGYRIEKLGSYQGAQRYRLCRAPDGRPQGD